MRISRYKETFKVGLGRINDANQIVPSLQSRTRKQIKCRLCSERNQKEASQLFIRK